MKRKSLLLLLLIGLLGTLATMYILWPVEKPLKKPLPLTREAAFLDADPRWADSLLKVLTPEE